MKEVTDLYTENYKILMKLEKAQMERCPVFLGWHVNIAKMSITTQSDLQIQCNPYQNSNCIFHRNIKKS